VGGDISKTTIQGQRRNEQWGGKEKRLMKNYREHFTSRIGDSSKSKKILHPVKKPVAVHKKNALKEKTRNQKPQAGETSGEGGFEGHEYAKNTTG